MQAKPTFDVVLSGFPRMSEQPVKADRDARSPSMEGFMVVKPPTVSDRFSRSKDRREPVFSGELGWGQEPSIVTGDETAMA